MNKEKVIKEFGLIPETIGNKYKKFFIIEVIEEEEEIIVADIGDLCIKTKDGNNTDKNAVKFNNFVGMVNDYIDPSILYYYYRPLKQMKNLNF